MNFTNPDNEFYRPGHFEVCFQPPFSLFCVVKPNVSKNQSVSKIAFFVTKQKNVSTCSPYLPQWSLHTLWDAELSQITIRTE